MQQTSQATTASATTPIVVKTKAELRLEAHWNKINTCFDNYVSAKKALCAHEATLATQLSENDRQKYSRLKEKAEEYLECCYALYDFAVQNARAQYGGRVPMKLAKTTSVTVEEQS